jgi:hypothetical protein
MKSHKATEIPTIDDACSRNNPTPNFREWQFINETQRIFSQSNPATGVDEWYFLAREGTMGPYGSREYAKQMLIKFKAQCQRSMPNGGRTVIAGDELLNLILK